MKFKEIEKEKYFRLKVSIFNWCVPMRMCMWYAPFVYVCVYVHICEHERLVPGYSSNALHIIFKKQSLPLKPGFTTRLGGQQQQGPSSLHVPRAKIYRSMSLYQASYGVLGI